MKHFEEDLGNQFYFVLSKTIKNLNCLYNLINKSKSIFYISILFYICFL